MELKDLPIHPIEPWMFPEAQELRREAPENLVSMIETGVLENVSSLADLESSQVSVLDGGENSTCFFLNDNDQPVIVKFRHAGSSSETKALIVWGEHDLPVPKVISHGIVPGTQDFPNSTKYLVEEAIMDNDGNLSKSGYRFIAENPGELASVADRMGKILAGIHSVKANGMKFGGFADTWGNANGIDSFEDYLVGSIKFQREFLTQEGLSPESIDSIIKSIQAADFSEQGVYIHGDYGLHNVLVRNDNAEDVIVFDPNPLVADPYWDIAPILSKLEVKRRKAEANPQNIEFKEEFEKEKVYVDSLIKAYKVEMGEEFDEKRMDAIQFVRLVRKIDYGSRKEKAASSIEQGTAEAKAIADLEFYRQMMRDLAAKLISNESVSA